LSDAGRQTDAGTIVIALNRPPKIVSLGVVCGLGGCIFLLLRQPWFEQQQIVSFFLGLVCSIGLTAGLLQLFSPSREYMAITQTGVIGRDGETIPISAINSVLIWGRAPYRLTVKSADKSASVGGVGIALKTLQSSRDELVKRCAKLGVHIQTAPPPIPMATAQTMIVAYLGAIIALVGFIIWIGLHR
jgi:hypothetical protein